MPPIRTGILAAAAVAMTLGAVSGAAAQDAGSQPEPFDRDCMDDYGRRLCDGQAWSGIVESFGVAPAETLAAEGWRGVRVFTVDGYSHDMPMVSVLAREFDSYDWPSPAIIEVWGRARGDEPAPVLRREAWSIAWWAALELQELAAESPVRQSEASQRPQAIASATTEDPSTVAVTICLHAWLTITESLGETGVVRRVRNACGEDPVYDASYDFSELALNGFPHCNHLDPAQHRNESTRLQSCLLTEGPDRVAAAELLNILQGRLFRRFDVVDDAAFAELLAEEARLTWGDSPEAVGRAAAAAAFLAEARAGNRTWLWPERVTGRVDGVEVEGLIERFARDSAQEGRFRQTWRRDAGGEWRLHEFRVEPLADIPPPSQ